MEIKERVLDSYVFKGDKVVVACSGGADSMCLLSLMLEKKKYTDFEVVVLHINHNIRGEEAKRDEEFVLNFCKSNNLKFECVSVDAVGYCKKNKKTLEQGARELRYDAFNKVALREKANKIAVAHHIGDQAETILMHIFRGSSLKGASGMGAVSGSIIRPLLDFSREDIVEYNTTHNIPYQEDSTNSDPVYKRNFIRHSVLPEIEKAYPSAKNAICEFAKKCKIDDDFISSLLPLSLLKEEKTQVRIFSEADETHDAIKFRLIKLAFEKMGVFADIEQKHLKMVADLFKMKSGASVSLPNTLFASKVYDGVVISKKVMKQNTKEARFETADTTFEGFGRICVSKLEEGDSVEFGDGCHYVDLEKIPISAIWRTRRNGDVFAKLGSGSKKLNDYFTDKKVERHKRDNVPVLAYGNQILIVAGFDVSENVKITGETEQIIKIAYEQFS